MSRNTFDSYIRSYKINEEMSPSERAARLLNDLAIKYPQDFISRRLLAKFAFNLTNVPLATSDYVRKRLPSCINAADRALVKLFNRRIISDRVEGIRASANDADLAVNRLRKETRRMTSAHAAVVKTSEMITLKNLPPVLREEVTKSRQAFNSIGSALENLPQLPSKGNTTNNG